MPFVIDKFKSKNGASVSEEFALFNRSSVGLVLRRLTNERKFILRNKYILLPHPLFSTIIYSDAMKEIKLLEKLQTYNSAVDYKDNCRSHRNIYYSNQVVQQL